MIKRIVVNLLLFGVIIFALDFIIGRTLRYFYFKESSGLHYRTTYSIDSTRANILVFGSSRANHHYVPEIFEDSLKMTYYNTGRDGINIFYELAVLKTILNRYTPKVIILDYTGEFAKDMDSYDRLSSLLPYYRSHKEIRDIIVLKSQFEKIKLISEIYPFNSQLLTIAIGNSEINKKRKPDNKGYVPLSNEWQAKIDSIGTFTTYSIDSNKLLALKEFLNIAKKSRVNVFVIYSPIFQKFNSKKEIDICREVCSFENVPFWNFSKDTLFLNHNKLFQDVGHLNHHGAVIFSKLVVDKIKYKMNNICKNN
jgi:hypothetical protein